MKIKKILAAFLGTALFLGQGISAFAADSTVISFEGEAEEFITAEGADFSGMMPGETRTVDIVLSNNAQDEMSFYMSGEIPEGENLAEMGSTQTAIYYLTILRDGEEIFYGEVGSAQNAQSGGKSSIGLDYLAEDTLLATLKKGETSSVQLALTLDGDSMNDDYQEQAGNIRLSFGVSYPVVNDPGTVTKTVTRTETVKEADKTIIQKLTDTVKTGDNTLIAVYAAAAAIAAVVIIAAAALKRRKR